MVFSSLHILKLGRPRESKTVSVPRISQGPSDAALTEIVWFAPIVLLVIDLFLFHHCQEEVIGNLKPGTEYRVTIAAYSPTGKGRLSSPRHVITVPQGKGGSIH